MKTISRLLVVFALIMANPGFYTFAQVSINTDGLPPDNSAMLDVRSTTKGMLVPRMTTAQRNAISNPANGLLIYCTDNSQYYSYKNSGSSGSPGGWILIGSQWLPAGPGGSDIYFAGGKVGVGNYNPSYSLDVAGDINYTGMLRLNGVPFSPGLSDVTATSPLSSTPGSPGNTRNISISQAGASANGFLSSGDWNTFNNKISSQWSNSAGNIAFITGNVGIGQWSQGSKLAVAGNIETTFGGFKFADGTIQYTAAINITGGTSGQTLRHDGSSWVNNSVLFNDGTNVGIGTTAPGHLLTVAGIVQTTTGGIMFPDGTLQTTASTGFAAGTSGQTPRHNGTSWIGNSVLFNDGTNVGIGTTSPGQKLTVAGTIQTTSGGVKFPDGTLQTTAATGIATGTSGQTLRHNGTNWVSNSILFNDGANVGIGSTNPAHARLELNGSVGAAVAMFGADKCGITIEADNPEIGFNYFFNGTTKTIKAGYGAVLGMDPGNGEMYIGNFNGNQSSSNFGNITGYQRVITFGQSGHVGIGMGNPTRAGLEQHGVVGSTAAVFGGEGAGISLQKDWPAIGFNHYFDGSNHYSIGAGFSAQLGLSQTTGSLYLSTWNQNAVAGPNFFLWPGSITTRFFISKAGNVGIGVEEPISDLTINQSPVVSPYNTQGIRLVNFFGLGWNLLTDDDVLFPGLLFSYEGTLKAVIYPSNGSYHQISDIAFKKNISSLKNTGVLEKVMQLLPVSYLMKEENDDSKHSLGFISQDVEKIFPEVVSEIKGIKMMAYSELIPVAIQAIKEQQEQIEALKKQVLQLQSQVKENDGAAQQIKDLTNVVAEIKMQLSTLVQK